MKKKAEEIFNQSIKTLKENLENYDTDFWSLYKQSGTKMKMLASPFYRDLHIYSSVYNMTRETIFKEYSQKWQSYKENWFYRTYALVYKIIFKIFYY